MNWEQTVLELLSASLVRPFILVLVAAVVLCVFRVEHPASKHAVWTVVLIGMVVVPFLSLMAPRLEFEALPAGTLARFNPIELDNEKAQPSVGQKSLPSVETSSTDATPLSPAIQGDVPEQNPGVPESGRLSAGQIVLWVYMFGVLASGAYRLTGVCLLKRLLSRSERSASRVLLESADIVVPSAAGILQPVVLLPSGWREWDARTRRSVIAHEFAHIRRKDLWVHAFARWARCLLWFHPLSWWLARKISELAEVACDAAAVTRLGDAEKYSKVLLEFAAAVSRRGYKASLPGLAMLGRSPLGRRIDQVFAISNGERRTLTRPAAVLFLIGVPCVSVASVLGLTESTARPLRQVQQAVAERIERVAQIARSTGAVAAMPEIGPPEPPQPLQSISSVRAFLDQYCVSCHSSQARYADLNFADSDLSQVRTNAEVWEKVVRKFRSGLEPRAGTGIPVPDALAVLRVTEWLENELDRDALPYMPPPGPHRFNRTEYANALRDVVGLNIDPALLLPSDHSASGFDNIASALGPPTQGASVFAAAADRVSEMALGDPSSRQTILICGPPNAAIPLPNVGEQEACARQIVAKIATRAFRRPSSTADVESLMAGYRTGGSMPGGDFFHELGIRRMLRAVLADSRFWSRTEFEPPNLLPGTTYRISDMELASRLSYFLWSRGPDDRLIDLASRGQLNNASVLEQETRRMLKDSRAQALTVNFAAQWLNVRDLRVVVPMPQYPDFDESLRQALQLEIELFFSTIVQEDRNVVDLLTANYTFVNERLARHYGIPNVAGNEFRRVNLTPDFDVRRGLLGKGALLAVTARADRTSIVVRGKFVLRLLGAAAPDPPPNVPVLGPKRGTMREMMEHHESVMNACGLCHRGIDPPGIALDNFDQAGKWRTQDDGKNIDATTELIDGTRINGVAGLRDALVARSDQFVQAMTERLLTYGLGRRLTYRDMPAIRAITRDAARDNNRFSAIVVSIVRSPVFQMNAKY